MIQGQKEKEIAKEVLNLAEALGEKSRERRRDFHRFPETAWYEMRTSAVIAKTLTELGYEVLTGRQVCLDTARKKNYKNMQRKC